jgi:hypothetical protein
LNDNVELVKLIGQKFIARKDVKSFENHNGEWHPVKEPMTMQDFENHLSSRKTMGHYLVNPEDQSCKLFAYDLDVRKPDPKNGYLPRHPQTGELFNPRAARHEDGIFGNDQLHYLAEGLARRVNRVLEIPVAIYDTGGKGLHVYCFTGPITAEAGQELAHKILESYTVFEPVRGKNFWRHTHPEYQDVEIETFPKQAHVKADGFGNLMRLPLGEHSKTKSRGWFLSSRTWEEMNPIHALEGDLPWE